MNELQKDQQKQIQILPGSLEADFVSKLKEVFGAEETREILRLIRAIIMRRMHSILIWSNWYLTKLDIAGLKIRTTYSRYFGNLVYEMNIRVSLEDVDPLVIKKNLRQLYKMAKLDRDQERVAREIEAIVEKYSEKKQMEELDEETVYEEGEV